MSDKQIYETIDKILTILEQNFKYDYGKKIPYDDIYDMMNDLYSLFCSY